MDNFWKVVSIILAMIMAISMILCIIDIKKNNRLNK